MIDVPGKTAAKRLFVRILANEKVFVCNEVAHGFVKNGLENVSHRASLIKEPPKGLVLRRGVGEEAPNR
jgi:hypothetical protein